MIAGNTTLAKWEGGLGYLTWLQLKAVTICLISKNGLLAGCVVHSAEQLLQPSSVVAWSKVHIKDNALVIKVVAIIDHIKGQKEYEVLWLGLAIANHA